MNQIVQTFIIMSGNKPQDVHQILLTDSNKLGCLIVDFLSLHEPGEILKR
jgi:hypothetical protein